VNEWAVLISSGHIATKHENGTLRKLSTVYQQVNHVVTVLSRTPQLPWSSHVP